MKKMNFQGVTVLKKTDDSENKKKGLECPKSIAPARSPMATVSNAPSQRGVWFLYALLFCAGIFIAFIME